MTLRETIELLAAAIENSDGVTVNLYMTDAQEMLADCKAELNRKDMLRGVCRNALTEVPASFKKIPTYYLTSDNVGSIPLIFYSLEQAKAALVNIFAEDAALEEREVDPALLQQIDALTDNESGVELHGYGMTQRFTVRY